MNQSAGARAGNRARATIRSLRVFFEIAAVVIGSVLLTRWLMRLSGGALWLPPEWRQAQLVIPALGMGCYTLVRTLTQRFRRRWIRRTTGNSSGDDEASRDARTRASLVSRVLVLPVAVVALALAVVGLWMYFGLRQTCVHKFQPTLGEVAQEVSDAGEPPPHRDWWWQHFGDDEMELPPIRTTSVDVFTADMNTLEEVFQEYLDPRIPPFLDRRSGHIYLPRTWPPDWRERLVLRGDGDLRKGVRDCLTNDPMTLIEWLQLGGAEYLRRTTTRFFGLHVFIILCVSTAAGVLFAPAEAVLEEIADLFA